MVRKVGAPELGGLVKEGEGLSVNGLRQHSSAVNCQSQHGRPSTARPVVQHESQEKDTCHECTHASPYAVASSHRVYRLLLGELEQNLSNRAARMAGPAHGSLKVLYGL